MPSIIFNNSDGVSYDLIQFGRREQGFLPAGICEGYGGDTNKVVCDPSTGDLIYNFYDNDYCLGDPVSNFSITEILERFNASYTITCCSGIQCSYATETVYSADSNCNPSHNLDGIEYYLTDVCTGEEFNQCANGILTSYNYSNGDCFGTPDSVRSVMDGECLGYSYTEINCGLIAEDTCQGDVIETPEPTDFPWPIFSTTMFPISDDLNWCVIKFYIHMLKSG